MRSFSFLSSFGKLLLMLSRFFVAHPGKTVGTAKIRPSRTHRPQSPSRVSSARSIRRAATHDADLTRAAAYGSHHVRSASSIPLTYHIAMRPNDSKHSGRRSGRGPRRSSRSRRESHDTPAPQPKTLWDRILGFFKARRKTPNRTRTKSESPANQNSRKPEAVEVTSPKLYVGNLSFEATESDLFELFSGVGAVRNAEIVTHKHTEKSKGFAFVLLTTVDEAKRAVSELHDKEFLGRKLVVTGSKSGDRETNYRG